MAWEDETRTSTYLGEGVVSTIGLIDTPSVKSLLINKVFEVSAEKEIAQGPDFIYSIIFLHFIAYA